MRASKKTIVFGHGKLLPTSERHLTRTRAHRTRTRAHRTRTRAHRTRTRAHRASNWNSRSHRPPPKLRNLGGGRSVQMRIQILMRTMMLQFAIFCGAPVLPVQSQVPDAPDPDAVCTPGAQAIDDVCEPCAPGRFDHDGSPDTLCQACAPDTYSYHSSHAIQLVVGTLCDVCQFKD